MQIQVYPSELEGVCRVPSSKSMMQRAVAASLLSVGNSCIQFPGKSNDCLAAVDIAKKMGAEIRYTEEGKYLYIDSPGITNQNLTLNCGEAGLGIRMFTSVVARSTSQMTLTGTGSLMKRPMSFFEKYLPELGVDCTTNDGYIPIVVKGPINAHQVTIDGSLSSQYLTGILLATGEASNDVTINVENLKSKKYADMTLEVMKAFGINVINEDYECFIIPAGQKYQATNFKVEGDWSGAAFLIVAAVLSRANIRIENLQENSQQADKAILEVLDMMGITYQFNNDIFELTNVPQVLKAFHFDATDCPDLFPPLVTLAAYTNGSSTIMGAERLTHKESNRAESLASEFAKVGVKVVCIGDAMHIQPKKEFKSAVIDPHNDHRIAMALATFAVFSDKPVSITNPNCIAKSYPDFYLDLKSLGAKIYE